LVSSLTMGLCVRSARLERQKESRILLLLTMFCGVLFLCIKGYEWHHHMHEGLFPGRFYNPHHDLQLHTQMAHIFFGVYYTMTGMHALHIVVGLGLMVWMLVRINRREFNYENYIALENTSLFWHLVDVVWIFVYPLIYLIG
ncbi:MAG: cytochrome c oxidase subunit 3, partial [Silvanigrellaceae bacterium]|nr:cytochrome c oxidase subunit 3 [Silvanigrellaceae bacterium]